MGDQVGPGVAYTCTKNVYKFRVISRDMNSKAAKNNKENIMSVGRLSEG